MDWDWKRNPWALALVVAGVVGIAASEIFPPLNTHLSVLNRVWLPLAVLGMLVAFTIGRQQLQNPSSDKRTEAVVQIVLLGAVCTVVFYGLALLVNGLLDRSDAYPVTASITKVNYSRSRNRTRLNVYLRSEENGVSLGRLRLKSGRQRSVREGDKVILQAKPGLLGLPWISSYAVVRGTRSAGSAATRESDPSPAAAEYRSALEAYNRKDNRAAIARLDAAIALDPAHAPSYELRGGAHDRLNQIDLAIADWKRAVELNPQNHQVLQLLGQRLTMQGEFDESIDYLTRAIELKPDLASAYYDRAVNYARKNDVESALRDAQKSCELGFQQACQVYERQKHRLTK